MSEGTGSINTAVNNVLATDVLGWQREEISWSVFSGDAMNYQADVGCVFCDADLEIEEHKDWCAYNGDVEVWRVSDEEFMLVSEWTPTTRLEHAMMALEKMRRANGGDYSVTITELGDYWHVTLGDEHRDPIHNSGFSTALEWAICRVILKALEQKHSGD